jgi:hypothetical protein
MEKFPVLFGCDATQLPPPRAPKFKKIGALGAFDTDLLFF